MDFFFDTKKTSPLYMQTGIFLVRILLFLNPIPVHHPDIFFAVDNHMVYHADPQLLVKLCDWGIQFLQGADKVVDLCNPADILFGGNRLFLIFLLIIPGLFEPPVRTLRATIPENESHIFR